MTIKMRELEIKEGLTKGFEKGRKEGIEQGINKRNIEIAKNMLKQNLSIDMISSITGLSIEEINNLK